jgi:hypothetical protein
MYNYLTRFKKAPQNTLLEKTPDDRIWGVTNLCNPTTAIATTPFWMKRVTAERIGTPSAHYLPRFNGFC